jgi:hypothetical protein
MTGTRHLALAAALLALFGGAAAAAEPATRFQAVDVFVDAGPAPLAAYQVDIEYDRAVSSLVGVEGGDRPFQREPYYDPKGLTAGRIVVADFSIQGDLPRGRIRVARLHLEMRGDPGLTARLAAAATAGGGSIPARVTLIPFEGSEGK